MALSERVPVLLAAGGAGWEASAVRMLGDPSSGAVLLKRCVDLHDLLATASTGQAAVAVMDEALAGLDGDSVGILRRSRVGVVLLQHQHTDGDGAARAGRLGVEHLVPVAELSRLPAAVRAAGATPVGPPEPEPVLPQDVPPSDGDGAPDPGQLVAVWGPTGAPGRTTVAVGLAAELARRGTDTLLLDVDGYGGTVTQHLGILDEISGLLAAARMANAGQLDQQRLGTLLREVGPALRVLSGLPRADRWREVRSGAFERLLELSRGLGTYVVADTGFCLEQEPDAGFGGGPQRNGMTVASLEDADQVVVVGSADPVGLARLARGLVELLELVPGATLRIVVNRTRASLGWGEQEIRAMVEGFTSPASLHLLPEDRVTADRALLHGRSTVELGESALRRAVAELADAVTGTPVRRRRRLLRR